MDAKDFVPIGTINEEVSGSAEGDNSRPSVESVVAIEFQSEATMSRIEQQSFQRRQPHLQPKWGRRLPYLVEFTSEQTSHHSFNLPSSSSSSSSSSPLNWTMRYLCPPLVRTAGTQEGPGESSAEPSPVDDAQRRTSAGSIHRASSITYSTTPETSIGSHDELLLPAPPAIQRTSSRILYSLMGQQFSPSVYLPRL